ncbi:MULTISPECIES: 2-C-methyl-D-erythritol 4-phosphate cytidylyltransferase [unclassified Cupriavidus]|jgi:2-C-methyl-D-erythritol 4-phosphate cytidylyltransferase|uniref:2-C-methyl-D-erythritol 4-phosphate cytidylyltransferase n=1 Tax=unclassified Cupriavidus TaxID=2640874 RepID=UPI001C004750|nr:MULTISPECIES: 2-C-methyl-D-erythritol 4-phosphate cytidylyltransferase [unclassified Cupriavidus]MCA3187339.1 2-C-methyl-D-erythritol 4-phosphate cytidylyltransferase [Cupriavidus sp.]MCA3189407.1 2-C-methyl-D-erythritol 4-phosphate cytidylyltransferase [Cupriavidus sp.]MCA3195487.1 2-C-methyl-D-erythritol 4-phosphate cytidylyltransferase [Cupriavidus sp.]MCA3201042.1 2-C-methyl-D-erythritol 4-phosphate cytidylyltransferase [Cupriavidus sp.]MCA3210173.1 2-C-methyl-D-erythritol 4-phosphate c
MRSGRPAGRAKYSKVPQKPVSDRRFALIPCAGTGSRAGGTVQKQYQTVAGRPMLWYALAAFSASEAISATALVLAPDDMPLESRFGAQAFAGLRFDTAFVGGDSRHASVLAGLHHLVTLGAADTDWVLVHDAARPGLTAAMIDTLVRAVESDDSASEPIGGILAVPVPDTLKRADAGARIGGTVPRDGLWQAQTPQMFRIGVLRHALEDAMAAGAVVTDEASAIERLGLHPRLVNGSLRNFKVTYPEDFALADVLLRTGQAAS